MMPIKVFLWAWMSIGNQACGGWVPLGKTETPDLAQSQCLSLAERMAAHGETQFTCSPDEPKWRPFKEPCAEHGTEEQDDGK